jgi:hypothetical protein
LIVEGQYSINSQAFTCNEVSVVNGYTIRVQHTASSTTATRTDTTLTFGGISNTFTLPPPCASTTKSTFSSGGGGGSESLLSLALLIGLKRIMPRKRIDLKQSASLLILLLPIMMLQAKASLSEAIVLLITRQHSSNAFIGSQ